MGEQDDAIDFLGQSFARQKELAHAIGEEAKTSSVLIEEITDNTDETSMLLEDQTRVSRKVLKLSDDKVPTCLLALLALLLVVLLIVLGTTISSRHKQA